MKKLKIKKGFLLAILAVLVLWVMTGCTPEKMQSTQSNSGVQKGKAYSTKDEVAAYLNTYDALPVNYLTKKEAMNKGWDNKKGNLWDVTDKMSIGGDKFGNREKILPNKSGRQWYECDVNYTGGYRGAERILYSNDGLIYYSSDHYASAKQLY